MYIKRNQVAIIGAGRVGSALANVLNKTGYRIVTIIDKDLSLAKKLRTQVQVEVCSDSISKLIPVDLIFITVTDDSIETVVNELKVEFEKKNLSRFVFHTSGTLTSDIFKPIQKYGISTASFHPIQTFFGEKQDYKKFENIYVGIEGEKKAVLFAIKIANHLGAKPILIPKEFKPLYHLACTITSNYLNTLLFVVVDLLKEINYSEKETLEMLFPLISTTLENIKENGFNKALTGPIARGDVGTVEKHLSILLENFSEYTSLYQELGKVAMNYPDIKEKMEDQKYQALEKILNLKN